jgi:3-deoxy-D-manno-octulosonate 8-phosphate phosphatase (KDO 8-P phosphatase)
MDGLKPAPALPWGDIGLFAMDVDGILTDGSVGVSSSGDEVKFFSVLDGLGLARLGRAGVPTAWISGRQSGATTRRAAELKIPHLVQGRTDKLAALQEIASALGLGPGQCAYMGDDDIDAPALRWAAIGVSVPGAMPAALAAARHVTARGGGRGAVREICELILEARRAAAGNPGSG